MLELFKDSKIYTVAEKVYNNERINFDDAVLLYNEKNIALLGILANHVREKKNGRKSYYIKNVHIEPTNICEFKCKFCSFYRNYESEDRWFYTEEEVLKIAEEQLKKSIDEIHIVGGSTEKTTLEFYQIIFGGIRNLSNSIHIKALTASEIHYIAEKANLTIRETLSKLKDSGLNSIPGGGAEILKDEVRMKICPTKINSAIWLNVHKEAHLLSIPSNATMLYGHVENYEDRVFHLQAIRDLQDETKGFNAFIPLKYHKSHNKLGSLVASETTIIEDLKNYAVCRIFLDNITHIKSYWPMIGKETTSVSLCFGVDDIDGTIDDSTKIYTMAGAEEQRPTLSEDELRNIIVDAGFEPIHRDSLYNEII